MFHGLMVLDRHREVQPVVWFNTVVGNQNIGHFDSIISNRHCYYIIATLSNMTWKQLQGLYISIYCVFMMDRKKAKHMVLYYLSMAV